MWMLLMNKKLYDKTKELPFLYLIMPVDVVASWLYESNVEEKKSVRELNQI